MSEKEIKTLLKKKTANRVGAPSKFTRALADEICLRIGAGESLLSIVDDEHMPDYATIWKWRQKYTKFRNSYAQARETRAEAYEELMMDTARSEEDVNRARLIVDTMKWTASKLKPGVYGDKVEHSGQVDVVFHNGIPRPKAIEADATSSVPKQIKGKTTPS